MNISEFVLVFNDAIVIYTLIILTFFCISIITASIYLSKHKREEKELGTYFDGMPERYIPVSILVPSYNEEQVIVESILSLMKLDYEEYEVIVVNDGSSDNTFQVVIDYFKLQPKKIRFKESLETQQIKQIYEGHINNHHLLVVDKENGGKSDALNAGINISKYPLFIAMDADCIIKPDAVHHLVFPMLMDKRTIAVGGNIKISNNLIIENGEVVEQKMPKGFFVIYQIIEYMRVFMISRIAWNQYKSNLIISGAFGLFRKDKVIEVGGYRTDTVGEDMELVVRLNLFQIEHNREYRIQNQVDAYCFTQVPNKFKDFKNQRIRWHVGLMQSIYFHRKSIFNFKYHRVGLIGITYYTFFEMLSAVIEIFGYVVILIAIALGLFNMQIYIFLLSVVILYSFLVTISAMTLEQYSLENKTSFGLIAKLTILSLFEPFIYRQLCNFIRIYAMFRYKSYKNKWNKGKRMQYENK